MAIILRVMDLIVSNIQLIDTIPWNNLVDMQVYGIRLDLIWCLTLRLDETLALIYISS